jgi:hypothetical protein
MNGVGGSGGVGAKGFTAARGQLRAGDKETERHVSCVKPVRGCLHRVPTLKAGARRAAVPVLPLLPAPRAAQLALTPGSGSRRRGHARQGWAHPVRRTWPAR